MIQIIPAAKRFHFENDWLSAYWLFSFDTYHDPANVNWGPLRVFNHDTIRPGAGFPMHAHREMEILTYVLEGALEHRDSLGNHGVIRAGELQRMSAGTGIEHSEHNASKAESLQLLQFWIKPAVKGLQPSWEQREFAQASREAKLLAVAGSEPRDGMLKIHQDATVYVASLSAGTGVKHELGSGRRAFLYFISGELNLQRPAVQHRRSGKGERGKPFGIES